MDTSGPIPLPETKREKFLFYIVIALAAIAAGTGLMAGLELALGDYSRASTLSNIAAGLSMPVLAALTAVYAYSAGESARLAEKEQEERKRGLRKALLSELKGYRHRDADDLNFENLTVSGIMVSKLVFEANCSDIGLLTEEEVAAIVGYYSLTDEIENRLELYDHKGEELMEDTIETEWEMMTNHHELSIQLLEEHLSQ